MVAVLVGCALTLPISSLPMCVMLGIDGLVSSLATYATMSGSMSSNVLITEIVLLYFVAPAIISLLIDRLMRHKGWIKPGKMKL